ncbi:MAG: hypothetical protein J2O49_02055 [Sciscionella sp.]|nr:hypothetical protein [Sciscionella sp.]
MTLALLAQREPAFAKQTRIEPEEFGDAAWEFANAQGTVESILSSLGGPVSGAGSTIGTDQSANYFWGVYQPAASWVLLGFSALHELVGSIGQGLAASATDHARADAISAKDWRAKEGVDYTEYTVTVSNAPQLPTVSDLRGLPGGPSGDPVLQAMEKVGKDDGKLRSLISAWRTADGSLQNLKQDLNSIINSLVLNNSGEDVSALEEFWAQYTQGEHSIGDNSFFTVLDELIVDIASALDFYGQLVDRYQQKFKDAIEQWSKDNMPTPGFGGFLEILLQLFDDLTDDQKKSLKATLDAVANEMLQELQSSQQMQNLKADTERLTDVLSALSYGQSADEAWQAADQTNPADVFTDPDEQAIASKIQGDGHVVQHIDANDKTKTPDALVDGKPVEFKTITGSGSRTIRTRMRESQERGGQSDEVVLNVTSNMSRQEIQRQVNAFFAADSNGTIKRVTVFCPDGSKVTYPAGYEGL